MKRSVHLAFMGGFAITCDEEHYVNVAAKSKKGISLLELLVLHHGETMSTQRLIREMWNSQRVEAPDVALKTMVSRTRSLLNKVEPGLGACIASGQGGYYYQDLDGVTVDVLELQRLFKGLKNTDDPAEMDAMIDQVLALYQGDLYVTGDLDSGALYTNWLHRAYLDAVYAYIEELKKAELHNRIAEVCRRALKIDEFDEQLHMELMRAMVNLNRTQEAMAEYRKQSRRSIELDGEVGEDMVILYHEINDAAQTLKFNLDAIRNELSEKDRGQRSPFFCDYATFKEIYNIQMRNLERLGSTMFLACIMIDGVSGQIDSVNRESAMAGLMEILRTNLRKGDIVTRFSENIVALLLPTVNYATGRMVMERLEYLFFEQYDQEKLAFHYRVSPLGQDSLSA